MKRLVLIYICLLFSLNANAQQVEWSENGLTWIDFRAEPITSHNYPLQSELRYVIAYKNDVLKQNDTITYYIKAYSYMEANSSWANPQYQNDALLKYNQLLFDIVELYTRKLQKAFYNVVHNFEIGTEFSSYNQQLINRIDEFRNQSENGSKEEIVNYWSEKIKQELANIPKLSIPKYSKGFFGYGMHIGAGYRKPIQILGDYFEPNPTFMFELDLKMDDFSIALSAYMGSSNLKQKYLENNKVWEKDLALNAVTGSIDIGYKFAEIGKGSISPFLGIGFSQYSESDIDDYDADERKNMKKMLALYPKFGIKYDYQLISFLSLQPGLLFASRSGELSTIYISTNLYATSENYFSDLYGMSIMFSISVSYLTHPINILD